MHVHHLQEEGLTVERGTMGYRVLGEEERRADPGEGATFAPGVGHRFWHAGDGELVCTGFARPPDNLEYFPVIVAIGRVLGWHRRFAGAPEPVRRP
jgi:uncharacterized cupin superfamily protein